MNLVGMVTMVQKLRIFIDPLIKARYGPEICWTWRLLLTSIGYCWEEVPLDCSDCDIAYAIDIKKIKNFKLCVHFDENLWDERTALRLVDVGRYNGLSYPLLDGKHSPTPAFFISNGRIVCERDIILDVFWLITGQEEKYFPKDKHGFFDLSNTAYFKRGVFRLALASSIVCWVEDKLLTVGLSLPLPRWPANKQAAACLSHDVDYPEIKKWLEPLRVIRRLGLSGVSAAVSIITEKKSHWHFSSWVESEKKRGVRSAFYFSAVQGSLINFLLGTPDPFYDVTSEKLKQLFRYLTDEGFEIGLHASYNAYTSLDKFASERRILQESTGQKIHGNRHHYWHLNPNDIESTLMLHEQIGFKYDSSLAHEQYVGWRGSLSWPFFPFYQKERRELKTLQILPTWMDNQLFGYLKYNPGDRLETLRALIARTKKQGGCLVINIHSRVFDDILFPDWRKTYLWLVENLIERSDFWIGTPGEIADHWINRYNSIVHESRGLEEGS
jgi:hypothetical protein